MTGGGRIGVFGGAFDPPHVGHLVVAQDVFEVLRLDRLLVIPAARPPHRSTAFGPGERLELTRAAFAGDERIQVSDLELRRPGVSWTVDTLEEIRAVLRPDELFLVMGVDQYRVFETWKDPEGILRLARLVVLRRSGEEVDENAAYPCLLAEVTRFDVSSSRIRDRLEAGRTVRYLVPESIRERVEQMWKARPHGEAGGRDEAPREAGSAAGAGRTVAGTDAAIRDVRDG
jgi:nicotinate-nucleotide adenylyltransferase